MAKYKSKVLIAQLHQQTETQLSKAIKNWQNMSPDILNSTPAAGGWSAAQCLEHLNIYGRYYLPAIDKAIRNAVLQKSKPADEFQPGWLGEYFTNLMKPDAQGHLKRKLQAPKNARPSCDLKVMDVVAEFIDQQEKLQLLLRQAALVDMNKIRVPISIAKFIKLKLGDVFMFLIAHNERHILQAERALRSLPALQLAV